MDSERSNYISVIESGKRGKAEEMLLRWMDKNPTDFLALGNYADIQFSKANHGLAIHLYKYLMDVWKDQPNETFAIMWGNIAQSLMLEGFKKEAEYAFDRAMELNPNEVAIYNARSACHINQNQPDQVIYWANKALECDPGNAHPTWNRSIGYLEKEMWDVAWDGYDAGPRGRSMKSYKEGDPMRQWDGKRNRCVVAYGEQGVGDEVMFGTCLPDFIAKCKDPIIDCHPRLEKAFKRSFPGVPVYPTRKAQEITWHTNHKVDSQISMASLPKLFRRSADKFPGKPYLKADPERIQHYRAELEKLGPGPYVGITWFGGEKKTRFDYRMIPLENWGPILDTGCQFISLQYNKWGHKEEAVKHGIPHWDQPVDDLDEQFALIMALDLVISVCQSVVHFSGALGKECWCLAPSRIAWRYGLTKDTMIWYGETVHMIRQKEGEDWEPVVNEAARRLTEYKENYENSRRTQGSENIYAGGSGGLGAMEAGESQAV